MQWSIPATKNRSGTQRLTRRASIGLLMLFAAQTAVAQNPPGSSTYVNFRIQNVKPDQVMQWESLRREMTERMQREGQPFYHVYQRVVGPANAFLIVTPAAAIGETSMAVGRAPAEPVPQSWFDAMNGTLISQTLMILQTYPELATRQMGSSHPAEEFAHVRIRTPAAGQDAAFEDWLRNDLAPGLRAAQAGDVRFARIVLGGSPRTWVTFSFVQGWPESGVALDPNVIGRGAALIASQTDYLYRLREDLSFTAR